MPLQVTDPTLVAQGADAMNNKAMMAYYNAKLKGDSDTLAFQKAQAALKQAGDIASAYGYAPGGDWYTFGPGGPTQPAPGTQTQSTLNQLGTAGAIPGYTGFNSGQTLGAQSQYFTQAGQTAGLTGVYTPTAQSAYSPGTWVQLDPNSSYAQQYGQQVGYVQPNGQLQRVGLGQAAQMGYSEGMAATIPYDQFMALTMAPPTALPQQTIAGQQGYQQLNTGANANALSTAGVTGMYQAPQPILQPGYANDGSSFYQQDQATQKAYLNQYGDPNAALQAWTNATNTAINQTRASQGLPPMDAYGYGGNPGAQETLSAQDQYFNQAQQLATMYGQYYTPGTPGQAGAAGTNMPTAGQTTQAAQEQAYTQWLRSTQESREQWTAQQTAAQNYLTLMSQLRGPADYAQYQKVLGATPGGMKDLVSAAAGQYVPASGATTGTQPQSVSLGNFVGGTTGGADTQSQAALGSLVAPNQMAPQTWNALQPSQQQMLLGVWESQGYNKDDAKNLFTQSLPKYATNSPSTGSFRLQ